jgi:flagellar L-ring protein precursor FlgH
MSRRFVTVTLTLLLPLAGCSTMYPRVEIAEPTHTAPQPLPEPPATSGAIFQAATYRPLFEDHRARLPGDTLTVRIVERVNASQKSTSSIDKSGQIKGSIVAIPGVDSAKVLSRAAVEAGMGNTFGGKGATENSNDFTGTITAVVREVLPNGHLVITGEKQIGVNANVDVLRFSGQVDPRSIQAGNSVLSGQIANVRLEHRGRGAQADAQAVGWLQRAFFSLGSPL